MSEVEQMRTIKVSEANEVSLNWLVAKCHGKIESGVYGTPKIISGHLYIHYCDTWLSYEYAPASNWLQGGPIIESEMRNGMHLAGGEIFSATYYRETLGGFDKEYYGPTPLIAAMRCYVASKLGEVVEVPYELECEPSGT